MVDEPVPGKVNAIGNFWKPWFFTHVATYLESGSGVEYIPLRDYYHRHTRSMFWEMEMLFPIGNHPLVRLIFNGMLPPKVSFLKLTQTEMTERLTQETHVAQDFMLPMEELASMMAFN